MAEITAPQTYTLMLTREEALALRENLGNQEFGQIGGYGSPLHELFKVLAEALK